ncbi:AAA family ATPase [Candidatus Vidania fulgoroideorum]
MFIKHFYFLLKYILIKMDFYNKYEPKKIKNFFGHKYIIRIIRHFKRKKFFPNGFIFYGKKGTGKTSFSKILFRYINCSKSYDLCGKCKSCKIDINRNYDFFEVDSSSNRKVEEVKKIVENFKCFPLNGVYKIIVFDEAQMLSIYSFNYLLKIIENIKKKFIFVFITTKKKKIPDTIKSRCFFLKFRSFSNLEIINYLKLISKKEKIKISKKSLNIISENSSGSLRDSLVLLQHSHIISKNKKIKSKVFEGILNIPNIYLLKNYLKKIIKKDNKSLNNLNKEILKKKFNLKNFFLKIFEISFFYLIKYDKNKKFKYKKFFKIICETIKDEMYFIKNFDNDYFLIKYINYSIISKFPKTGFEPVSFSGKF